MEILKKLPVQLVRDALFHISEGLIVLDSEWRTLYINAIAEKLLGTTREGILGKVFWEVFPRAVGTESDRLALASMAEQKSMEYEVQATYGDFFRVRTYPFEDKIYFFFTNITEKRVVEEQKQRLKESEDRYRAFVATSSEGIWRFELDKPMPITLPADEQVDFCYEHAYLAECNDAMARMYGLTSADQLIGARVGDLLVRDDPTNVQYLRNFIRSGYRLVGAESREVDAQGNDVYFENSLVGIIEDGCVLRAWGVQVDVTERKKLNARKDEFISIASHELRTPLTSLGVYVRTLEKYLTKKEDLQGLGYVARIHKQTERITNLVETLLDTSKIESGKLDLKLELVAFDDLVRGVVEDVESFSDSHIFESTYAASSHVFVDRFRIGQVIMNLVMNSVKYSPGADRIVIKTYRDKDSVVFSVTDFGIGIPVKNVAHVFERFYRVDGGRLESYPGLGLGLYISYEIVQRHQGKMWVESELGKGSTFYFSLPVYE